MFATVLIASRLESHLMVTELMLHSVLVFILMPMGIERLRPIISHIDVLISPLILGINCYLFHSRILLIIFLFGNVIMNILGPMLMVYVQRYKMEIRGPWDEAVIDLDT